MTVAGRKSRKGKKGKKSKPRRRELKLADLTLVLERAKAVLRPDDYETVEAVFETLTLVTQELEAKQTSVSRLRKFLFGASTEKTSQVLGKTTGDNPRENQSRGNGAEFLQCRVFGQDTCVIAERMDGAAGSVTTGDRLGRTAGD